MKRIILGLSLILMLIQNGFAKTDAEYDKKIANESEKVWKQTYRCNKAANNHRTTAKVSVCLKAIKIQKNTNYNHEVMLANNYLNAGVLYDESEGNYLKAYEFWMKSAKLGNTNAQHNLNRLCKKSPWACK